MLGRGNAAVIRSHCCWPSDLVALLENVIREVRRPRPGHIFHPKIWVLRFLDRSEEPSYRLLVLSRNLTGDRSWDTILWLDGRPEERPLAINEPLARFVAALSALSVTQLPSGRRAALAALAEELRRVHWDRPAGVREVRFHPIGLPGSPPFPVDEHFAGYRTLVISPFVRGGAIRRLLRPQAETAVLVSRGEELDALPDGALEGLDVYELDPVASLSGDDVAGNTGLACLTRLHAKLFVVERARLAHVFIGSANATDAGLGSNVEFLCELVGPVATLGVHALVGEEAPFRGMLTPYVASARQDVDEASTAGRALEDLLLDIAAEVRFRSTVTRRAEGWVSRVTSDAALPHIPEGARVTIAAALDCRYSTSGSPSSTLYERIAQSLPWDIAVSIRGVKGHVGTSRPWFGTRAAQRRFQPTFPRDDYTECVLGVTARRLRADRRALVQELAGQLVLECGLDFDAEYPGARTQAV